MPYKTTHDAIGITKVGENHYESAHFPERLGNVAPIAYGGCQLGFACRVGHQGIPSNQRLYAMSGNFLGPSKVDRNLIGRITEHRRTRTFTTRLVTVSQKQDSGEERTVLVCLIDFHAIEPATLFTYSAPPTRKYPGPEECPSMDEKRDQLFASGQLSQEMVDAHKSTFELASRLFESRGCPGGISTETLLGYAKGVKTDQDSLAPHEQSSADWWRTKTRLESREEQAAALAFQMDRAVSFMPLTHHHMSLMDAGASSTLDFALRVFDNEFDLNEWHMTEWKCVAAGVGRVFNEARLFNRQGALVASMTQQCIMRPLPAKQAKM